MIRQYHRMLSMDDSRLTKQIFLWDKERNQKNIVSTWSSEVRGVFETCNVRDMFDSSTLFDLKLFVANMKETFTFLFDMRPVPYCTFYKYLGVNINEFLDFQ